jgi:hypothetical protein
MVVVLFASDNSSSPVQKRARTRPEPSSIRTESIVTPPVSQPRPFAGIGESRRDLVGPGQVA